MNGALKRQFEAIDLMQAADEVTAKNDEGCTPWHAHDDGGPGMRLTRKQRRVLKSCVPKNEKALLRWIETDKVFPHLDLGQRLTVYASLRMSGPLKPDEQELSDFLVAGVQPCTWYHGGVSGLSVGDYILPPSDTGADPRGIRNTNAARQQSVFFTRSFREAVGYASYSGEAVYAVQPEGRIICDPEQLRALILYDRHFDPFLRDCDGNLCDEIIFEHVWQVSAFCAPRAKILDEATSAIRASAAEPGRDEHATATA